MQSPDGTHYAYAAPDGIHDVDLVSNVDRNVLSGVPDEVVQFSAEGIYVTKYGAYTGHLGLWLIDPPSGVVKQLLPVTTAFDNLGGGAAWYAQPRTEAPSPGTLTRIDLGTGARTVWFAEPNVWVVHLGTDASGNAVVGYANVANLDQVTLAVMSAAGHATVIRTGSNLTMAWIVSVIDRHGIWFDSSSAGAPLWLLQSDDQLIAIAQAPVWPLGACQ